MIQEQDFCMANSKKKKPDDKAKEISEFDEILRAKINKDPVISTDDIQDFQIDVELHNKRATKENKKLHRKAKTRKPRGKGK